MKAHRVEAMGRKGGSPTLRRVRRQAEGCHADDTLGVVRQVQVGDLNVHWKQENGQRPPLSEATL